MKLETQQSGNGSKSMDKEEFSPISITESILANVSLCLANVARFNFLTTYACVLILFLNTVAYSTLLSHVARILRS